MILLADSGATKTHWCLLQKDAPFQEFFTSGINPTYLSQEDIELQIVKIEKPIQEVYFYGAGCAPEEAQDKMRRILMAFYPEACVQVESDMLAAARGLCGHHSGLVCILGTGSNSCYYDGEKIAEQVLPTGYLFGDEGSGYVLGRAILSAYLKKEMEADLYRKFKETYNYTFTSLINQVYGLKNPKAFIASFSTFLSEHRAHPQMKRILETELNLFLEMLRKYTVTQPLYFTGSIASVFEKELTEIAQTLGFEVASIQKNPMQGLIAYHYENMK